VAGEGLANLPQIPPQNKFKIKKWLVNILVFKTNVEDVKQVKKISPHLRNIHGVLKWNIDLHDCDKVLRVEVDGLSAQSIEVIVQNAGYFCKELD